MPEAQVGLFRRGQPVEVPVPAFPDQVFRGSITALGATVDPNTRRAMLRVEVGDPARLLQSGMFADFTIRLGEPERAAALPAGALVREGDGTMTAWVTADGHRFQRRALRLGAMQEGWHEVLEGLAPGEPVTTDNAVLVANAWATAATSTQVAGR